MATIRKRSAGWEVQVRRHGYPVVNQTLPTKADAVSWAAVVESEMARGAFIDRSLAESTTFGDLLTRYAREITVHKKGARAEGCRVQALLREPIARAPLSHLTGQRLAKWRDERHLQVFGSTVNRDLNLFSHMFNVARKEWAFPIDNPVALVRRPKNNRGRTRRLSREEEERLLAQLAPSERSNDGTSLPGGSRNPWAHTIVLLALETAMRRGEILSIRWSNVFLDECYLHLPDTKNGEPRDVPLSTRARALLAALPRGPSGRVFPLTPDSLKQVFERAVVRAEIHDFRFHDLRHEATSRLATRLDNVLELSAVTGHKTLGMLKRYYHPRASDLAKKLGSPALESVSKRGLCRRCQNARSTRNALWAPHRGCG